MKFIVRTSKDAKTAHVFYWCPGCKCAHTVPADRWNWNKNVESPTLSPSVRHFYIKPGTEKEEVTTCHYHLRNGILEFCADSQHEFKGQNVPLQEIPENYGIPESI